MVEALVMSLAIAAGEPLEHYEFENPAVQAVGDGPTRVSVYHQYTAPRAGGYAVRFAIDNSKGPAQRLGLEFSSYGESLAVPISTSLEIAAGERRQVFLPVPATLTAGQVSVKGKGFTGESNVYFNAQNREQHLILAIGTSDAFESFVGAAPDKVDDTERSRTNQVLLATEQDVPELVMALSGYSLVVISNAATLERLSSMQREALEQYVLGGGSAIIRSPVRSLGAFPLVEARAPGDFKTPYGFGTLEVTAKELRTLEDLEWASMKVVPRSSVPKWAARSGSGPWQLLPQATPPLSRFLVIILAFVLAIGPGSIWVARRRGPTAVLFTVPIIAFITCTLIIGYSAIAEGFQAHRASYSFTLLDAPRNRAFTAGLNAYYANIATTAAAFPASTTLVVPWFEYVEHPTPEMDWTEGLKLGTSFMPARKYREWGFVSTAPARARLQVRRKASDWVVMNALGHRVDAVSVNLDGALYAASNIANGAEAALRPSTAALPALTALRKAAAPPLTSGMNQADSTPDDPYASINSTARFDPKLETLFASTLKPNEFCARIAGDGFMNTGGVATQLHDGQHLVRGALTQ